MQFFAHLDAARSLVLEVLTVPDGLVLGDDLYTQAMAEACVPCGESIAAGMLYDATTETFAAAPPRPADLATYAKAKRDETEAAGITVNGIAVASDPDSQTRVANAYSGMQVTGATSIRFKATSGFIVLTFDQVKAVGSALFAHTQACFDAESQVDAGLTASPPTITTEAQVDAIFAKVASTY